MSKDKSAFGDFLRAQQDTDFLFYRLSSEPVMVQGVEQVAENERRGFFSQLSQSPAPRDLLLMMARKDVLQCVIDTGVPLEKWTIEFSPVFESFNIPSHLFLSNPKDREWISL